MLVSNTSSLSMWSIWWMAVRPRTLSMAISPVLIGAALAWHQGGAFRPVPLLAALLSALAIQIGTNLANDASDGESGLDQPDRAGPPRVTALGLATPAQVRTAAKLSFALAALFGLVAIYAGGLPILAIGVASLLAGWSYSRGPAPIAASPFGEVFVLVFFGIAAVGGTHWLMGMQTSPAALVAGILAGLPAAAVLLVNNHRDRAGDARNGRRTLAILAGVIATQRIYAGLLVGAVLLGPVLGLMLGRAAPWLTLAALPMALSLIRMIGCEPIGAPLNALLARTAAFQMVLASLLIAALVWE